MFALTLILFIVGLLFVYDRYRMRKLPPHINGRLPIIGHSYLFLTQNIFKILSNAAKCYQENKIDLLSVRVGLLDIYIIANPEAAYMVANSNLEKDTMYNYAKSFIGYGLLTAPVVTWKVHRKLLNSTFNQHILDGYLQEFNRQAKNLADTLADKAGKGFFNHSSYLAQTVLDTICSTSMGSDEDMVPRNVYIKLFKEFLVAINERFARFWLHSNIIYYLSGRQKQVDMLADKMKVLSKSILKRKRTEIALKRIENDVSPRNRFKPFLEHLLELNEEGSITEQEVYDELNTFIIAGTDTISSALTSLLARIGSHSDVQERILEELQEVFGGSDRDVEKQDLSKLKYVEAVIKETLRMHPPAPLIGRILSKEMNIDGYTLPVGSKCYIAVYILMRHWSWGPDVNLFRPERWLDGSLPQNMKGFAVFGLGKRNCIGYNFSIMALKTICATILRRYSIKSDVTNMVQEFYVTSKPISGHEISIEKR